MRADANVRPVAKKRVSTPSASNARSWKNPARGRSMGILDEGGPKNPSMLAGARKYGKPAAWGAQDSSVVLPPQKRVPRSMR